MIESQIETGMPYMLYKDAVNEKTNQKNLGTIKSSNLCAEELEYADEKEINVCNISSLGLPMYVEKEKSGKYIFNFKKLFDVVYLLTIGMNKVIDYNFYPVPETKVSNMRHRPILIGAQGLANVFMMMKYPYESPEAALLNKQIYETIYYASLMSSCDLAKKYGSYETFKGSPFSKGLFQHNLWGISNDSSELSGLWDWELLKDNIIKYGTRNSLLTGSPPTASTSQILGNYESFEPIGSNLFMRSTLAGEFPVVNKYLINDLIELKLWNDNMKNEIMKHRGSIQNIDNIPANIKELYKTVWEISQKNVITMSRDRGLFTDHSQSLNLYIENPDPRKLRSMYFYGWKQGLKTGLYYLRTQAKSKAISFTVTSNDLEKKSNMNESNESLICSIENRENCMACSG